jgi:hypothetical protein
VTTEREPPDRRDHPDKQQPPPDNGGRQNERSLHSTTTKSIAPERLAARQRLRRLDHERRNATACHRAGLSLVVWYCRPSLLHVGLGELPRRGVAA